MKIREIIILLAITFVLLIGYKSISSGIDEQRQKSVLQEQSNLSLQAKEPLNQCINDIEEVLNRTLKNFREEFTEESKPEWKLQCENTNMAFRGNKGSCIAITFDHLNEVIKQYTDQAKIDEQECYKRYK